MTEIEDTTPFRDRVIEYANKEGFEVNISMTSYVNGEGMVGLYVDKEFYFQVHGNMDNNWKSVFTFLNGWEQARIMFSA